MSVEFDNAEVEVFVKGHRVASGECKPRRLDDEQSYDNEEKLFGAKDREGGGNNLFHTINTMWLSMPR